MTGKWIPDLPFNEYHRFIASSGVVFMIIPLIVDPEFIPQRTVFEMGAVAVFFGIVGWLVEYYWVEHSDHVNFDYQVARAKAIAGDKSELDEMIANDPISELRVSASRAVIMVCFVAVEVWLYAVQ